MVGMADERWGEVPAAFVSLRDGLGGHEARADRVGAGPPRPLQGAEAGDRARRAAQDAAPARSPSRRCGTSCCDLRRRAPRRCCHGTRRCWPSSSPPWPTTTGGGGWSWAARSPPAGATSGPTSTSASAPPVRMLSVAAAALVRSLGPAIDLLVHATARPPRSSSRIAAELRLGHPARPRRPPRRRIGQACLPARWRWSTRTARWPTPWTPDAIGTPPADELREWAFLALVGAVGRGQVPRPRLAVRGRRPCGGGPRLALQLHAAAQEVDYPAFGLTSILDADEPAMPMWLEETYSAAERDELRHAAARRGPAAARCHHRPGTAVRPRSRRPAREQRSNPA